MDLIQEQDIVQYDPELRRITAQTGFEPASSSCLKKKLYDILPRYATSYRDAAKEGNQRLIKIYEAFKKNNIEDQYQFVHVVLTDGQDNFSKISFTDFIAHITQMKREFGQKVKCYYIGLDLQSDYDTKRELKKIAATYGPNGQFFEIDDSGIENIFLKVLEENHIKWQPTEFTADIQQNQETYTAKGYAEQIKVLTRLKYVVVFTLDCSYSMFGIKWTQVQSAVVNFVNKLNNQDYVLGIVFNTGYTILTFEDIQQWNQVTYDDNGNKQGAFTQLNKQSQPSVFAAYQTSQPSAFGVYQTSQIQPQSQFQSQVQYQQSTNIQQSSNMQFQSSYSQQQQYSYQQQQQYPQQQPQQNNSKQVEISRESQCCQLM